MRVSSRIEIARPLDTVWEAFTNRRGWKRWWGGPLRSIKPGWEQGAALKFRNDTFSITLLTRHHKYASDDERPGTRIALKDRWGMDYEFEFEVWYDEDDWDSRTGEALPPTTAVTYYVDDFASEVKIGDPVVEEDQCARLLDQFRAYVEDSFQSQWVPPPPLSPAALAEKEEQLDEEIRARREAKKDAYARSIRDANRDQLERIREQAARRKEGEPDSKPSGYRPLP